MAVSDVFLVSTLAKGIAKGAFKAGSHTWDATRKWYSRRASRSGAPLEPGQEVHHWFFQQNQGIGKNVPEIIKNQPWNLLPMPTDPTVHRAFFGRWGQGTPHWAKNAEAGFVGDAANALRGGGDGCGCS